MVLKTSREFIKIFIIKILLSLIAKYFLAWLYKSLSLHPSLINPLSLWHWCSSFSVFLFLILPCTFLFLKCRHSLHFSVFREEGEWACGLFFCLFVFGFLFFWSIYLNLLSQQYSLAMSPNTYPSSTIISGYFLNLGSSLPTTYMTTILECSTSISHSICLKLTQNLPYQTNALFFNLCSPS